MKSKITLATLAALTSMAAVNGLDFLGPLPRLGLHGAAVVALSYLLWHRATAVIPHVPRSLAVGLLVAAVITPELAVEVRFASEAGLPHVPGLTTAALTGASRMLVGLGWPLAICVLWARSGAVGLTLPRAQRVPLWFLMLAALYAFTIYLKASLTLLDSALLVLLFAAYVWTTARQFAGASDINQRLWTVTPEVPKLDIARAIVMLGVLGVGAGMTAVGVAHAVLDLSDVSGGFGVVQWLVPVATKSPLLVVVCALVWRGRTSEATSTLAAAQFGLLTLTVAVIPVAFLAGRFGLGNGLELGLDDTQRSALLLVSAQTVLLVTLLSSMSASAKGGLALLALFLLQAAVSVAQPGGPSGLTQVVLAFIHFGASGALVIVDRARLLSLTEILPVDQTEGDYLRSAGQDSDT